MLDQRRSGRSRGSDSSGTGRQKFRIALIWTRSGNWAMAEVKANGLQAPSWQQRFGVSGSPIYVEVEAGRWADATARLKGGEGTVRWVTEEQAVAIARQQERLPPLPTKTKAAPGWWAVRMQELEAALPEEVSEARGLPEGSVRRVTINEYERNSTARARCIEHHGTTCAVCEFDFGKVYGPVAEGHIQVHHLKPLSSIGERYEVDPINDLRPVCANCHSVIHLRGALRRIEEVRALISESRELHLGGSRRIGR